MFPDLYNAVLEHLFREFHWKNYGVKINGELLNNVRFADDRRGSNYRVTRTLTKNNDQRLEALNKPPQWYSPSKETNNKIIEVENEVT